MNPVIYKLTNKINNKIYIGQTINFNRRMHEILHRSKNEEYISLCKIIDEEDVETIENLFDVFYIKYDE